MGALAPIGTVAILSFRGGLQGLRTLALAGLAAVPTLVILALVAARADPSIVVDAAQSLFLNLTLIVVVIVVVLVVAVGQFRTEIDDDTLAFLSSRSIPRWGLALGKYLGSVAAAAVILLPSALLPIAVAVADGAAAPPAAAVAAILVITILSVLAYGAIFLLFGLVTPSALLLGLLYGFLWEKLLLFLPGSVPRLTIAFYLRSLGSDMVGSGPLSGYPIAASADGAIAAPILAAVFFVALTMGIIRYVELVPRRTSV